MFYFVQRFFGKIIRLFGGNFSGTPEELEQVLGREENACYARLIEQTFQFEQVPDSGDYWVADYHMHIHGTGRNAGVDLFCPAIPLCPPGVLLTGKRFNWLRHPFLYLQTKVFLSASGIENVCFGDAEYLQRLYRQIEHFPVHNDTHGNPVRFRFFVFAMAPFRDRDTGDVNFDKTDICVDSDYVISVADCFNRKLEMAGIPHRVVPVISVHPYRKDAEKELVRLGNRVAAQGHDEILVKWLPPSMGIDPETVRSSYYETMAEQGMVLVSHTGKEHSAISDKECQEFGNPLKLCKALEARSAGGKQLKVIMAHSGRKGVNFDDAGKRVSSYELFRKMMATGDYRGRLFGDMSAIPYMATEHILRDIAIGNLGLEGRMLNGSDYPVPAGHIIKPTRHLYKMKLISRQQKKALDLVYRYNPLLFDFVMKRMLHFAGQQVPLPDSAFLSMTSFGRE